MAELISAQYPDMATPRIFVRKNRIKGRTVVLEGPPVWYLRTVLRAKPRMIVILYSGQGDEHKAVIESVQKNEVTAHIMAERRQQTDPSQNVALLLPLPRKAALDLAYQKAVEMGVSVVQPVLSDHSTGRATVDSKSRKNDRWEQILIDATSQSGRTEVPELRDIMSLDEALPHFDDSYQKWYGGIGSDLPNPNAPDGPLRPAVLAIGPEGDFSDRERKLLEDFGFRPLNLGPRVLRVETAIVVGLTLLHLASGELSRTYTEQPWRELD